MINRRFIVGSRSSALAMTQTRHVVGELKKFHPGSDFEIRTFKTTGDNIPDVALSKIGDKGLFTKEIEEALLSGEADVAVHSMKDLPTKLSGGLAIASVTKREDPRDVLVSQKALSIKALPEHSRIGTSSLRRRAQILHTRPDLDVRDLRGNLDTRVRKLNDGLYDAIIVAYAGIRRLGLSLKISAISIDEMIPQTGQGALGIEIREGACEIADMVKVLDDVDSHLAVSSERALISILEGGCQVPIGAYAEIDGERIVIRTGIFSLDGKSAVRDKIEGFKKDGESLGRELAERVLKDKNAVRILEDVKRSAR